MILSESQRAIARAAIEATYTGTCNVYTSSKKKVDGETKIVFSCVLEGQPCALSQTKVTAANQTDINAEVKDTYKLFIAPEFDIPPGSKMTVDQEGMTYKLEQSGKPFKYDTHQEIMLVEESDA